MPRNSSGTYTLPSGNPVVSGTLIEASWANTTLSDLASAMTDSLSRDGEGGMTAALRLYDGDVSLPGLAFSNETSTGLYRAGAGDMRLAVTGSQVMQFLTTGVAVTGTLSATGAVSFTGQTATLENATAYYPQLINRNKTNDANGSYISLQKIRSSSIVQNGDVLGNVIFAGYDGAAYLQGAYINAVISATPGTNDMPTDLVFGTTADGGSGPTERMRIDKAGNLGLGVTPSAWSLGKALQVGTSAAVWGLTRSVSITSNSYYDSVDKYLTTGAAGQYLITSAGGHNWYTAASGTAGNAITFTQAMTLDASGNLLVGATSGPAGTKLAVTGAVDCVTSSPVFRLWTNNSTLIGGFGSGSWAFGDGTSNVAVSADSGKALLFGANGTEKARIDTSGRLLVGATSGTQGHVLSYGVSDSWATQVFSTTASAPYGIQIKYSAAAPNGVSYPYLSCADTSQTRLEIYSNGSVKNWTGSYAAFSDIKLKENIVDATPKLEKLMQVRIRNFNMKGEDLKMLGVVAQELETIFPNLIDETPDFESVTTTDEEGNEQTERVATGTTTKSVKYSIFVPMLIKAMQEQQAIIEQLQADVAALKG